MRIAIETSSCSSSVCTNTVSTKRSVRRRWRRHPRRTIDPDVSNATTSHPSAAARASTDPPPGHAKVTW